MYREDGFTIVETIVGVFLIAIAMAVALVVFIQATGTSERYVETTSNQADLTNAVTKITHSLSTSPTLAEATEYSVEFKDSTGETVRYMYFQPNNPAHKQYMTNFKTVSGETYEYGKKPRKLPSSKGEVYLVEIRTINGKANFTVLASGVSMEQGKTGMPLFTYYDKSNAIMTPPVGEKELMRVTRVGLRVVSATATRADTNAMELGTSISFTGSRFGTEVRPGNTKADLVAPGRAVLQGTLPRPTQKATLSWPLVAGANGYILYRDGNQIATLGESATSYVDNNRPWGGDQTYHLVAVGPGGLSPKSNSVLLRVVPERPAFTNVNPKATGAGSTVARDLTNHLSWTPRSGATGYKLFRGSELIYKGSNTSFADTGRNYGDVTSYTVIAYNEIVNNSGGDSLESAAVSLISPPPAPTLTAGHSNGVRNLSWTASKNATKYDLDRTTPAAKGIYDGAARSAKDDQAVSAATFTYRVRAGNDAGWSPWSTATVKPRPGPITLRGYDWNDGARGDRALGGRNSLDWDATTNATEYKITGGSYGTDFRWEGTSAANAQPYGSTTKYTVAACNITGCGPASAQTLKQAPGPFSMASVSQRKRSGVYDPDAGKGGGDWGNIPLTTQQITMTWGTSAEATSYQIQNGSNVMQAKSSSRSYTSNGLNPGGAYSFHAVAYADNGTYRNAATERIHMAPSAPKEMSYRPQTTNGNYSRDRYWSNSGYGPVLGTADGGVQYWLFTVRSDSSDWTDYYYHSGSGQSTWAKWSGSIYSKPYNKSAAAGGYRVGTVIFTRSVDSVPSNAIGGVSFTDNKIPWNVPGTSSQWETNIPRDTYQSPNTSWVMYNMARTGVSNPWTGSYSGTNWKDVSYSNENYPNSHDTTNQIKAR